LNTLVSFRSASPGFAGQFSVGVNIQQALLLGAVGLALDGKLQPLEHRHLVRELVDGRLLSTTRRISIAGSCSFNWGGMKRQWLTSNAPCS
jgi:hypothetical protein